MLNTPLPHVEVSTMTIQPVINPLWQAVAQKVSQQPDNPLITEDQTKITAGAWWQRVQAMAAAFAQQGVQPGDRVGLLLSNQEAFLTALFAAWQVGAVPVPLNIQLPPDDIAYLIQLTACRTLVALPQWTALFENPALAPLWQALHPTVVLVQPPGQSLPQASDALQWVGYGDILQQAAQAAAAGNFQPALPAAIDPDACQLMMVTSGTTGKPKAVMLSINNLLSNMAGFSGVIGFVPSDCVLLALPLFHCYGLIIGLYVMTLGARIVLVPNFQPKTIVQRVIDERVTVLPLVPTMFSFLTKQVAQLGPEPFAALRLCVSGGASLPPALLAELQTAANLTVIEGYGLTETAPVLAVNDPTVGAIPGSVGKPLPNLTLRLWDDEAQAAIAWTPGTESAVGEIQAKGPNVMLGYYQRPEDTQAVFTGDGWFATGDLGHFDAHGRLYISGGRKKDLIIKAGENIAPLRIEQVLYAHPAVLEACVIGLPHATLGEDIGAVVVLHPHATEAVLGHEGPPDWPQLLRQHCREHLPPFMVPTSLRVWETLPKNATGKIVKPDVKAQWQVQP